MNASILKELAEGLGSILPKELGTLQNDFERNAKNALGQVLDRFDLVTREEFEVQSAVLARTREKLEQLEIQITQIEASLQNKG